MKQLFNSPWALPFVEDANARQPLLKRLARDVVRWVLLLLLFVATAWEAAVIWYDAPFGWANALLALMFVLFVVRLMMSVRRLRWRLVVCAFLFVAVFIPWSRQQPRQGRDWQANVARLGWAEIHGDEVTLHNVRNFHYHKDGSGVGETPRWQTRTVHLSSLTGIDLAICYWGSPWMAHPVLSFQFKDAPPVCFSIETRKERGESYSAIGGLFHQFELICVMADESDALRLRSHIRSGEDVYLYHSTVRPEEARGRFLEYLATINRLRDEPQWYNAITTNCTTAMRSQRDSAARVPWDWRILVNGKGDELLYELGLIARGGLSFADLRTQARIDAKAGPLAATDLTYSQWIRKNRPGFTTTVTTP